MEFTGTIKSVNNDFITDELTITFAVNEKSVIKSEYDALKDYKKLQIKATKYRNKRSLDANAYLWKLLGEMAIALHSDKWDIYLKMLKDYGKYTHIVVKPDVVDAMKAQWREIQEVGEIEVNGKKGIQLLCYFGSSTYDSKEFSVLLDGVVSECKLLGIPTETPEEIAKMIALVGDKV